MRTYELIDAEHQNRLHPETFWIPPIGGRRTLQPGEHIAKLCFSVLRNGTWVGGERMWVEVTSRVDGVDGAAVRYTGQLRNNSFVIPLRFGDVVEFEPRHVTDYALRSAAKRLGLKRPLR